MAKPYFFIVKTDSLDRRRTNTALWNFLDMLRYDWANIVKIEPSYLVLATEKVPTYDRWLSFRIPVCHVTHDLYATLDAYHTEVRETEKLKDEIAADMKAAP